MQKENERFNIGLAILRTSMCFMVVLCHFWSADTDTTGWRGWFLFLRDYAVPVFMLLSFWGTRKTLVEHSAVKIKNRFIRLLMPQLWWSVIYWVIYKIFDMLLGTSYAGGIGVLFLQILTGHSELNATMWFQIDLILLTVLFFIVIAVFPSKYLYILSAFAILAFFFQYSGLNLMFGNLRLEFAFPLGRFFEMLPIAVIGFNISYYGILEKVKRYPFIILWGGMLILLIRYYNVFNHISAYGYSGVEMSVMAICIITLFYIIPFDRVPQKIIDIIKILTKYTLGIYCMHRLVGKILSGLCGMLELPIQIYSFAGCIFIYILSYLIAFIAVKINGNRKYIRMLFE